MLIMLLGFWKDDVFNGEGTYAYANGGRYDVEYRISKSLVSINVWFRYEGDWVNGVKHGQGTMIFDNKDKYVGQLCNNERHGEGKYYMASGDRIEGNKCAACFAFLLCYVVMRY